MRLISTTIAGPSTAPIIGDALRSVAPLVDSSLVVWTGADPEMPRLFLEALDSADDGHTLQDVRWWPWRDDFGAVRQAALDLAAPLLGPDDWSAMVDTDERVICPDPAALRAYLEALPADVHIVCVHTDDGTYSRERFFRSTIKARWYLRTHETIDDIDGARRVVAPRSLISWTELPKSEETIRSKCERDHAMLLLDLADHPGNGRVLFYLANSLEHLGRYEEALPYYRQVSQIGFGEGPAWACFCAARNHLRTEPKKIEEAYSACVAAIYREPRLAEPYWLAASICLDMGRPELALAMAKNAKAHGAGSECATSVGGFRVPFALADGPDQIIAKARAALATKRGIGVVADDVETSGERLVVKMVRRRVGDRPAVVFDVGANRGQWTRMARSVLGPSAEIHCFEPSAEARAGIGAEATRVAPVALSDVETARGGGVTLHFDAEGSGLASLHPRRGLGESKPVLALTLDAVCAAGSVEHIDLLKIDVEGHEIRVLRGASAMLAAGKIDAIQFEFGGACIDSRVFLRDFFDLLAPHGFAIHRVTPTGIEGPIVYSEREEVFVSSNFLALRTAAWGGWRASGDTGATPAAVDSSPAERVAGWRHEHAKWGVRDSTSTDAARAIIFSRDRPMQLDACLRSLRAHCSDLAALGPAVYVLVRATEEYAQAYREVAAANPWAIFTYEEDFEMDTRSLLVGCEHVLFVVDDTIFVRPFAVGEMVAKLMARQDAIGFSVRLGRNTTWTYPTDRAQTVPVMDDGSLSFDWTTADGDFGYPLEVSSSLYRAVDIVRMLDGSTFRNPNDLESVLAAAAAGPLRLHGEVAGDMWKWTNRARLLCAPLSLAFSVPCNRVQSTHANRVGGDADLTAEALLRRWQDGLRIDVGVLAGYTSHACHEDVAYAFERRPEPGRIEFARMAPSEQRVEVVRRPISITVTSTGFCAAEWAERCMESVRGQTFAATHIYAAADDATLGAAAEVYYERAFGHPHFASGAIDGIGKGLLANLLPIWRSLPPDEVIVWLDGDDWLATDHALERVAAAHHAGALVTYGSFMYHDGRPGFAGQCGNDPRSEPWRATHLKSFRAGLVQRIRESDWRWGDGSWLDLSIDQAVMLPCLEMAGRDRSVFIPEILCVYNSAHSFAANTDAAGLAQEATALRMVRARPRYERIGNL